MIKILMVVTILAEPFFEGITAGSSFLNTQFYNGLQLQREPKYLM